MRGPAGDRKLVSIGAVLFAMLLATAALPAGTADDATITAVQWPFPQNTPVQVVPLPQGGLLVAAQTGQVHHYTATGARTQITTVPAHAPTGEFGLLGMALHPDYPDVPYVYVLRTDDVSLPKTQSILRFTWVQGGSAGALDPVVTGLPANPVCCHNGGRIAFGPDGMLYATIGDIMVSPLAQLPLLEPGSILRYTPDGDVPMDNPLWPSPVHVWGLRNTFGITFDAEWGLIATDNGPSLFDGPSGYDRLFVDLQPLDNAGWPIFYGLLGTPTPPPFVTPVWNSGSSATAPTGLVVPRGSQIPDWDGQVIWCNYNQSQARILDPAAADPVSTVITAAPCRFDAAQDADGRIVFATSNALWVLS